ncbi:hypothetical protein [Kibdelosporangium phytohabitans]|nr:hypothetical protein [Kibdelosporangium phytohabitans]MBE1467366.1 hypothetical protein [Kibdelosporangium phytohabitans]
MAFLTDIARRLPRKEKPDLLKLTRDCDLKKVFTVPAWQAV